MLIGLLVIGFVGGVLKRYKGYKGYKGFIR